MGKFSNLISNRQYKSRILYSICIFIGLLVILFKSVMPILVFDWLVLGGLTIAVFLQVKVLVTSKPRNILKAAIYIGALTGLLFVLIFFFNIIAAIIGCQNDPYGCS
jgi:uncharacterized BrkB/YihY/UPF0761 family membrane protein